MTLPNAMLLLGVSSLFLAMLIQLSPLNLNYQLNLTKTINAKLEKNTRPLNSINILFDQYWIELGDDPTNLNDKLPNGLIQIRHLDTKPNNQESIWKHCNSISLDGTYRRLLQLEDKVIIEYEIESFELIKVELLIIYLNLNEDNSTSKINFTPFHYKKIIIPGYGVLSNLAINNDILTYSRYGHQELFNLISLKDFINQPLNSNISHIRGPSISRLDKSRAIHLDGPIKSNSLILGINNEKYLIQVLELSLILKSVGYDIFIIKHIYNQTDRNEMDWSNRQFKLSIKFHTDIVTDTSSLTSSSETKLSRDTLYYSLLQHATLPNFIYSNYLNQTLIGLPYFNGLININPIEGNEKEGDRLLKGFNTNIESFDDDNELIEDINRLYLTSTRSLIKNDNMLSILYGNEDILLYSINDGYNPTLIHLDNNGDDINVNNTFKLKAKLRFKDIELNPIIAHLPNENELTVLFKSGKVQFFKIEKDNPQYHSFLDQLPLLIVMISIIGLFFYNELKQP